MNRTDLKGVPVDDLVARFADIGIEDDNAEKVNDIAKRNSLRGQLSAIKNELKSRSGDQRSALIKLYNHPNMEVRLLAAKATLAVAPAESRRIIEWIAASNWFPYAGDAGMCLYMLDSGKFVPD